MIPLSNTITPVAPGLLKQIHFHSQQLSKDLLTKKARKLYRKPKTKRIFQGTTKGYKIFNKLENVRPF